MKIFISWSGETSRGIGEAFRIWLPDVLQFVQPYFTPSDIEKGQRWSAEIAANLEASKFGLMCITAENLLSPWLMFEAGAISKSAASSRVCPLLFGVETSQLTGPLLQFQATPFSKDEVFKFLSNINELHDYPLPEANLTRAFNRCWPELEEKINSIISKPKSQKQTPHRSQGDMIEEILNHVRSLANKPEDDMVNHWLVQFQHALDYGEKYLKIAKIKDNDERYESAKLLQVYLKLTLNLIGPKIIKANAYSSYAAKAQKLAKDLEKFIAELDDEDIPF